MVKRRAYDGLLLDAGGTLLQLANPVEHTYSTIAQKYGQSSQFELLFYLYLLRLNSHLHYYLHHINFDLLDACFALLC